MSFFLLLLLFFGLLHLPGAFGLRFLVARREKAAFAMAIGFLITGVMHFTTPQRFVDMMPPWLPTHLELVYLSGIFELLGAAGLLIPRTRRAAGFGLAALLVAILPANIYVAVNGGSVEGLPSGSWYYWLRLPFQAVFIAWALWCSKRSNASTT